jgi:hypothetical protein
MLKGSARRCFKKVLRPGSGASGPDGFSPQIHGKPGQVCADERGSGNFGKSKQQNFLPRIHTDDTDPDEAIGTSGECKANLTTDEHG